MKTPLTVLNDAMLLQCTAQLQSLSPAICLSILNEIVNQLAARKGALISNTMLLSQLQNGVLVCYKSIRENRIRFKIACSGGKTWMRYTFIEVFQF